jgi:hypothetical protein
MMILSPISLPDLPDRLARFERCVEDDALGLAAFRRIAATLDLVDDDNLELSQDDEERREAWALCRSFGMGIWEGPLGTPPADSLTFTYDGRNVRGDMEPSVIVHEVGHIQTCAAERRNIVDFGLGAGPETMRREEADAAMTVIGLEREMEEALASLQGILWEAELGHPAILAFLEQNWLEGVDSPQNRSHYLKVLHQLRRHGLIDDEGRPTRALRDADDVAFLHTLTRPEPQV